MQSLQHVLCCPHVGQHQESPGNLAFLAWMQAYPLAALSSSILCRGGQQAWFCPTTPPFELSKYLVPKRPVKDRIKPLSYSLFPAKTNPESSEKRAFRNQPLPFLLRRTSMPKRASAEESPADATEGGHDSPYHLQKKGPGAAWEDPLRSSTPQSRKDRDRGDSCTPLPVASADGVGNGFAGREAKGRVGAAASEDPDEPPQQNGQEGEHDTQARRLYVEWTLEDVGEKPMQLRYCSEQPPPLSAILTGVPVHVNLPGGQQRHGLLKLNPVSTRWFVKEDSRSLNLTDFCEGALVPKCVEPSEGPENESSVSSPARTGWLPRDVLVETETSRPAIPELEPFTLQTRQWFISNRAEILMGQQVDTFLAQLVALTNRRSRAGAGGRAGAATGGRSGGGGGGNAPEVLKKKREEGPPNPFNFSGYRFTPTIPDAVGVCLSSCDRAPLARLLSPLTVSGSKGYRSVRASHGVSHGAWLYELTIKEDTLQTNVEDKFCAVQGYLRFGWARSQARARKP
jgi:hypothetical protein